ncbi:MAG: LssY C-terminal domain-containing protein, partial [Gammaproteobacteria bacterium]
FDVAGVALWAGAATHDIGFERDERNGGVTHKIDPDVDLEREYVRESLLGTGLIAKTEYMTPAHAVKDARTATGGGFHSDGRTLVLYLHSEN